MSRPRLQSYRKLQLWQRKKDLYDMAIFRQPERNFREVVQVALERMESGDTGLRTLRQYDITKELTQKQVVRKKAEHEETGRRVETTDAETHG